MWYKDKIHPEEKIYLEGRQTEVSKATSKSSDTATEEPH